MHHRDRVNKDTLRMQQFGYTIAQWVLSIVVIGLAAVVLLAAGFLSLWGGMRTIVWCLAEFSIFLIIGLMGGLIPKGDYPIHSIGEVLLQCEDWQETLRSLYRKKWLNVVPDIFGLSPALFLFTVANTMVYRYWWGGEATVVIIVIANCVLIALSIGMIPLVCKKAHEEVQEQVKVYKNLPKKESSIA